MIKKVILHIGVDSFFVNCEVALNPELLILNREVAICLDQPNSVVTSLSYDVKSKGVKVPQKLSESVQKVWLTSYLN